MAASRAALMGEIGEPFFVIMGKQDHDNCRVNVVQLPPKYTSAMRTRSMLSSHRTGGRHMVTRVPVLPEEAVDVKTICCPAMAADGWANFAHNALSRCGRPNGLRAGASERTIFRDASNAKRQLCSDGSRIIQCFRCGSAGSSGWPQPF